jgi:ABC-type nickel/cobalt efflux system permease component RcnA
MAAGLIPCPLTLFVMTFAGARGVTLAGIGFAAMMLVGVGLVLSAVALAASLAGRSVARLAARAELVSRGLLVLTGGALVALAALALAA